jgi:asparagine synthetase B (glutamine-hydrolysing)
VADLPEILWQYGQPLADVSIVPTFYVAQVAKSHVSVVLNGDGGMSFSADTPGRWWHEQP